MRESDSFAFGPRCAQRKAPRSRHARSGLRAIVLGASAIASGSVLFVVAALLFAILWTSLGIVTTLRAATNLRCRLARSRVRVARTRHVMAATVRRAAPRRPRPLRRAPRWIKSRRVSAAVAMVLSFLLFGGVIPVHAAPNTITTVAGRPDYGDGGTATAALIRRALDVAVGPSGDVFVADTYNHRIRRVSATGTITTFAGNGTSGFSGDGGPATSAQLRFPEGVWIDTAGNLYIADGGNHSIRKVDASGIISTVAGTGTAGSSGDGGAATAARLDTPSDVMTDAAGNLYIADTDNHKIRKVDTLGVITTIAGTGTEGFGGDGGAATAAWLNDPNGVAFKDSTGTLYIGDTDNDRIRAVSATGTITTLSGGTGPLSKRPLAPVRLAVSSNNLYIADSGKHRIFGIDTSDNTTFFVAGNETPGFSGDGGTALSAQLDEPTGVAVDASGNVYIADADNHRVRRVDPSQIISTFAGKDHYGGDGGAGTDAALDQPYGVAVDGAGNFFVADTGNHRVRRVSGGVISTVAGTGVAGSSGDGGAATSARLNSPYDVAVDAAGNVYIADTLNHRVRKVDAAGTITTFAGTGTAGFAGDGGPASLARLYFPIGVDVDGAGNVYIADYGNHRIRRVSTGGTITTVAGNGFGTFCGDGGAATAACLETPTDVAVNSAGDFYIADYGNHRIRSVISGTIRTVAGNGFPFYGGDGGPATSAWLAYPVGVEVDPTGNVFIADSLNERIRKVDGAGIITTVAGNGNFGFAGDGGPAVSAELAFPTRVSFDANGNFFIADVYNNRIRMVEGLGSLPGPTMTGTTPASPANNNNPLVRGTAAAGTTVRIYTDAACSGAVAATGTAAAFADPGLSVTVSNDSTTSFYATATNVSGAVSACSTTPVIYIEDSTAPAAPVITVPPASPDSDLTPSWSFTAEAGATTECELSRGATILQPFASCTSPKSYSLAGEPGGDYTFRVRATDSAGNTGSAASHTYTLDSTSPAAPTITSTPATPDNDPNPTWAFTVEAGSTAECELSRGATILQPFASCTSPKSYNLSAEPDGDYTFRVQARDGAGNPSQPTAHTYTFDTAAPGAPTITSSPSSPGNSTSPSWSFTSEAGSTTDCQLTRGATIVGAWAACASPKTYNLTAEPDGGYTFSVKATDAAGNTGPTATSGYTLDTTGPVTSITSSPASPGNSRNPSWSFSTEAGASPECELRRSGSVVSAWAPCTSPKSFDLTGQPDDIYTFSVRATDNAGNTGDPASSDYTLDTTPPLVTITSGPAPLSSERNPTWSFESEAGVSFECELLRGAIVVSAWGPCSSPKAYDLSLQPDDTYTFRVRATDGAANTGPITSASYTLDTSGPATSITSSPSSPGTTRSPSWSFTTEAGATTECQLSAGATVLIPYTACTSPVSQDLSGQPDGPYTLSVHAIDGAGNVGAPASNTYTLDTTAPAAPAITSAPASPGNSRTPSWSFTTEAGATLECELSRGGVVLSPWADCTSPESYSLSGEPDGDYTFRVRATDAAGNTGSPAVSTYTLDTVAPNVSINGQQSPGNDPTPTWDFATEAQATTECQLSSGATILQPFAPCVSPFTYDLAAQPDGPYTLRVRATDAAGNAGLASSTYDLDTTAPVSTIVSGPPSPGSDTSPSWSFTAEAGATTECELMLGATVIRPYASCTSPRTYDIFGEGDGSYTFRVRATDVAGNTGPAASGGYTLDTTPPALPVITSAPTSPGTGTSPSWSFTAEAGATTECELTRGATVLQPFAACVSPRNYGIAGEPDGTYTFRVRATDGLGNTGPAAASSYTLDTAGPSVTITVSPSTPGNLRNPTWSFTTEAGATTECALMRGATVLYPYASCTSPTAFDLTGEPDGAYTFRARATDSLGNQGGPAASTYDLDTVAPVVTITAGPGATGSTTSPSWTFTTEPGATTECRLTSGGTTVGGWAACTSPKTFDISGQPDGSYTFHVRASDDAGNTSPEATETYTLATGGGGGTPPPDGGTPPPDGGTPPPDDGGITVSPDGGGDSGGGGGGGGGGAGSGGGGGGGAGSGSGGFSEPSGGGSEAGEPSGPTQVPSGTESGEAIGGFLGNDGNGKNERKDGADARTSEEAGKEAGGILPSPEEAKEAAAEASARAPRGALGAFIANVGTVAAGLIEQPVFPLSLIAVVVGFLVLQNRFDRRDPKLALAPVYADPHLYFENPQVEPGKDR